MTVGELTPRNIILLNNPTVAQLVKKLGQPAFYRSPKLHYIIHNPSPPDPILIQSNPVPFDPFHDDRQLQILTNDFVYKISNFQVSLIILLLTGIFVMERTGTLFRNHFLRETQPGMAFRNFFPDIGVINTTPLRPNFGSVFAFRGNFQKKSSAASATLYRISNEFLIRYRLLIFTHTCRPIWTHFTLKLLSVL
jgi:hypothetical protein